MDSESDAQYDKSGATSALVAQGLLRLSLNQEVPDSRPEVDTGGALVVWPGRVQNKLSCGNKHC